MIPALSQRNPQWGGVKIGDTQKLIRDYGCTITDIAMVAGLTPDEVMRRLYENGGLDGALVNWLNLSKAIPWLQFISRVRIYDNTAVLKAIEDNGFCLVEVDFDGKIASPNDHHWVLYLGNQRMNDPWTGFECATSKYPLQTGYCVIKKIGEPPQGGGQTMPDDITPLLTKYGVSTVAALDARIEEHVGTTWGAEDKPGGGYLGSARRDITQLKTDLEVANTKADDRQKDFISIVQALNLPTDTDLASVKADITKLLDTEDKYLILKEQFDQIEQAHQQEIDAQREVYQKKLDTLQMDFDDATQKFNARIKEMQLQLDALERKEEVVNWIGKVFAKLFRR